MTSKTLILPAHWRMKKVALVFCLSAFLVVSLARAAPASLVPTDLAFEGDFQFGLHGMYYVGPIGLPLNVMGDLDVLDNNEEKLGNLFLFGQENCPGGEGDETYFGHWTFRSVGGGANEWEMGSFPDLGPYQQQEDMLGFTLLGLNKALGMPEEIPRIVGSLAGDEFKGAPIPIPGTVLLLGGGLVALMGLRRKKIG